jgi:hypothetical protein
MTKKFKFTVIGLMMSLCLASSGFAADFGSEAHSTAFAGYQGMVLNHEGKGDLLLFPYYDVRTIGGKSQDTYFFIINENTGRFGANGGVDQGVVAKLRFHEWDKSEEVFDAEIWLSDNDVWVGALTLNTATGLARITSPDFVVTDYSPTQFTVTTPLSVGFDFLTDRISYTPLPSGWTKEAMTTLGYFEVIGEEMTYTKRVLDASGNPTNKVNRLIPAPYQDCPNSLMGSAYIVRVADGVSMGYNAVAIANFNTVQASLFVKPGDLKPDLSSSPEGLQQLEFQISKYNIFGAYSIETAILGKASLIVTFPTKGYHYTHDKDLTKRTITGTTLNNSFTGTLQNSGEIIDLTIFDRNENFVKPSQWWSPPKDILLPYEVNVCGIYTGASPAPAGRDNCAFGSGTFDSGWVWIQFKTQTAWSVTPLPFFQYFGNRWSQYRGLPALVLQLQEFSNGNVGGFYGEINDGWFEVEWLGRQ